jgi:predicted nuclease of predicted toxin-antitoxin system
VKFIVDNQLPVALAEHLRDRGLDCQHVLEAGLGDAADSAICRHAELQGRIIISKDEDFFYFAKQRHAKIKLIWVRLGNCRTAALVAAFERSWPRIESSLKAGDRIIEIR